MFERARKLLRGITGFSTPIGGVSWLGLDRKLQNVKRELREAATKALTMRALTEPVRDDAEQWRNDVASLLDSLIGLSAGFDFRRCMEGAGEIDLDQTDGVRRFLWLHANHLKERANSLVATDLPG